jgi:hypothetical protein
MQMSSFCGCIKFLPLFLGAYRKVLSDLNKAEVRVVIIERKA